MSEQKPSSGREVARKITIATVTGGPKKWFEQLMSTEDRALNLMRVIGYAHNFKPGATEFGEYAKILGQFRATNYADGVTTDAGVLLLPTFLGEQMAAVLSAPGRTGPVQFAFEIGAVFDAEAAQKFVYKVRDLTPATAADPLSLLANSIETGTPLLEAPALAASPAQPSATPAPTPASSNDGKKKR